MEVNIRSRARQLHDRLIQKFLSGDAELTVVRREVVTTLMREFNATLAAAATHWNAAQVQYRTTNPAGAARIEAAMLYPDYGRSWQMTVLN